MHDIYLDGYFFTPRDIGEASSEAPLARVHVELEGIDKGSGFTVSYCLELSASFGALQQARSALTLTSLDIVDWEVTRIQVLEDVGYSHDRTKLSCVGFTSKLN